MTRKTECTQFDLAMELLIENGFDGVAEAVGVLINSAMKLERSRHVTTDPYERSGDRIGYANGYKAKTMKTRLGEVELAIPQTRGTDFYPQSLERDLRSERALKLALAEMYIQGVSTRKVANSSEVSRASQSLDEQLQAWRNRPCQVRKGSHRRSGCLSCSSFGDRCK